MITRVSYLNTISLEFQDSDYILELRISRSASAQSEWNSSPPYGLSFASIPHPPILQQHLPCSCTLNFGFKVHDLSVLPA